VYTEGMFTDDDVFYAEAAAVTFTLSEATLMGNCVARQELALPNSGHRADAIYYRMV
jgi:hypothetical protein